MTKYEFDIALLSELFDVDLDTSYDADPSEAFRYHFYNHGSRKSDEKLTSATETSVRNVRFGLKSHI